MVSGDCARARLSIFAVVWNRFGCYRPPPFDSAAGRALMKKRLAIASIVLGTSMPAILAQQGWRRSRAQPRSQSAPSAARAAHLAHRSVAVSRLDGRAWRARPLELLHDVRRRSARHEPVVPPSRRPGAEVGHRRALSQLLRGDVRHPRRRSAVHHRRTDVHAQGACGRADAHGPLARDLQRERYARAVDEHQRDRVPRRLRRIRPR